MKTKTIIIAEAGVNHNGRIDLAHELIAAAAAAGADFVKFQTFKAERLTTATAGKAEYQIAANETRETQREMLAKLELNREIHRELIAQCQKNGIRFLSSGFDIESLAFLVELKADRIKIPSGEITNLPYLRAAGGYGLPIILSTGMATLGEIEAALQILGVSGAPRQDITLLHCSTEYPTPMEDVNLRAMNSLKAAFGVPVGYSDHTIGIEIAIAAVAMGASIIEKHFTIDRTLPGPDHKASLEPGELKALVDAIRNLESALGDGVKRPSANELRNRAAARKSLVASREIRSGEAFTPENVAVKRPGTGLSPMLWDEVIGRIAPRDFTADQGIEL
jgi:N,N'-diacetyllegionaminate synthase